MADFYLDIETTGLDPYNDGILTIQYRDLSTRNYADVTPTILAAWQSSEKEILSRFLAESGLFDPARRWKFVPVGFNLDFELRFLFVRAKDLGILPADARYEDVAAQRPRKDVQMIAVLMNGGQFKGASLDNFSAKPGTGKEVLDAYAAKDYDRIVEYAKKEMWGFLRLYARLEADLPRYWRESIGPDMAEEKRFLASVGTRTVPVDAAGEPILPPPEAGR